MSVVRGLKYFPLGSSSLNNVFIILSMSSSPASTVKGKLHLLYTWSDDIVDRWILNRRMKLLFRDFAYVARDRTTRKHMCHVFRCDIPARTIANTLRDICKKIMIERSQHQNLAKPIDINGRTNLATRPTNLPTEHRRFHRNGQGLVSKWSIFQRSNQCLSNRNHSNVALQLDRSSNIVDVTFRPDRSTYNFRITNPL